jgi:hypothetical protein
VGEGDVKLGKQLQPVHLALREAGLGEEVANCPTVGDHCERTRQVLTPYLKALGDGKEFQLMDGVLGLGG